MSCQTNDHIDVPYQITSPLPPIFGSQLCYRTPPINFLSRSLPSLDCICWVQNSEDEVLRDKAEEMLADQYDAEIKEFYMTEKERLLTMQLLNNNNTLQENTSYKHLEKN